MISLIEPLLATGVPAGTSRAESSWVVRKWVFRHLAKLLLKRRPMNDIDQHQRREPRVQNGDDRRLPIAIAGIPIDNLTMGQTLDRIDEMVRSRRPHRIATANVDFLWQANRNPALRLCLFESDLVLCDGTPLVWLSRLFGNALPQRVAGSDLVPRLLRRAEQNGHRVYLLGGASEVVAKAVEKIRKEYPGLVLAGHHSPPFASIERMDHAEVRSRIRSSNADIVLVSFGCPKQERWIERNYREVGAAVCIGVGATIDFLAGAVSRAPLWMRRCGLEWTFRLVQEPRRLALRYARNIPFIIWETFMQSWKHNLVPKWHRAFVRSDAGEVSQPVRLDTEVVAGIEGRGKAGTESPLDLSRLAAIDSTGIAHVLRRLRRPEATGLAPLEVRSIESAGTSRKSSFQ